MIDRRFVGHALPGVELELHRARLQAFAVAIGESDPVYRDVAAARAAGHPDLPVPPTFLCSAELEGGVLGHLMAMLNLAPHQLRHREQDFQYHRVVHAGDRVRLQSRIADVIPAEGSAPALLVWQSAVSDPRGEAVADLRSVFAVQAP